MASFYVASQLFTNIARICQNEMQDLSTDLAGQKTAVYDLINLCLWKQPRVVYWSQYSEGLTLSADGYATFKYASQDITDLFEPLMITKPDGQKLQQRTSDEAPIGWYRESQNLQIHIRGFSATPPLTAGSYTLKYLKYPKQITIDGDSIEIAPSGYYQLVFDVCRMIKLTRNSYQGAEFMGAQADRALMQTVQGAMSAKGTGQPPSAQDASNVRGG